MIRLLSSGAGFSLVYALLRDKFVSWVSTSHTIWSVSLGQGDRLSSVSVCVCVENNMTNCLFYTLCTKTLTETWMKWSPLPGCTESGKGTRAGCPPGRWRIPGSPSDASPWWWCVSTLWSTKKVEQQRKHKPTLVGIYFIYFAIFTCFGKHGC